jgi:LAS superfamily LD-carboxypeptidase LdcB
MPPPARVASLARLAAAGLGAALVMLLTLGPSLDGGTVRGSGPLPNCRYDDILTSPRGYDDWSITLVDTILRVPKAYVPPALVRIADIGVPGKGRIRSIVADDLKAMSDAAAAAGNPIGIQSAYRSYEEQRTVFNSYVAQLGRARALKISARPGHSEHQLGLTVDIRSEPQVDTLNVSWAETPAGKWMKLHGWEYGFVMSYPKGKIKVTCYSHEPWHWRYVGKELAAQVQASGLTLREYLWANYTTTVVPPPTPKPATTPKPTAAQGPASAAPSDAANPTPLPVPTSGTQSPPPTASPTPPSPTTAPSGSGVDPSSSGSASGPSGAPGDPPDPASDIERLAPVALAGLTLGTIVLGGTLFMARRGRSGVGL